MASTGTAWTLTNQGQISELGNHKCCYLRHQASRRRHGITTAAGASIHAYYALAMNGTGTVINQGRITTRDALTGGQGSWR